MVKIALVFSTLLVLISVALVMLQAGAKKEAVDDFAHRSLSKIFGPEDIRDLQINHQGDDWIASFLVQEKQYQAMIEKTYTGRDRIYAIRDIKGLSEE